MHEQGDWSDQCSDGTDELICHHQTLYSYNSTSVAATTITFLEVYVLILGTSRPVYPRRDQCVLFPAEMGNQGPGGGGGVNVRCERNLR